jgi:enoyl-CoA hydratase/carnithine racemase
MHALVGARLSHFTLHEAITTGKRYDAAAALAAQIAHKCAPESEVVPTAVALATELSVKNHDVVVTHKQLMYSDVVRLCPG